MEDAGLLEPPNKPQAPQAHGNCFKECVTHKSRQGQSRTFADLMGVAQVAGKGPPRPETERRKP